MWVRYLALLSTDSFLMGLWLVQKCKLHKIDVFRSIYKQQWQPGLSLHINVLHEIRGFRKDTPPTLLVIFFISLCSCHFCCKGIICYQYNWSTGEEVSEWVRLWNIRYHTLWSCSRPFWATTTQSLCNEKGKRKKVMSSNSHILLSITHFCWAFASESQTSIMHHSIWNEAVSW